MRIISIIFSSTLLCLNYNFSPENRFLTHKQTIIVNVIKKTYSPVSDIAFEVSMPKMCFNYISAPAN